MLDQDRFVVNLNSQILDKKNRDEPFLWFPWVLCAFLSPHTDFTDLTDIISLDANVFRALRGFCVPFFPHTDFTDLTDFISLDVNVFRALRGFCVPLSDPLNIRVHLWPLCALFYLTQNSPNSRKESRPTDFLWFPWFLCANFLYHEESSGTTPNASAR